MKFSSLLSAFLIFCNNLQPVEKKFFTLAEMVEYFALEANNVATVQLWSAGSGSNSPITWTDKEPQWSATYSVYTKTGSADILIDGIPVKFTIILSGTKISVNRVQFNLSKAANIPIFDFEKMLNEGGIKTAYLKCENPAPKSYGTLAYSTFIAGKKELWTVYSWQCLKGECSANFNIYYDRETVEKLPCY